MSTIPPNWLGSIIQTQGSQSKAAVDKQREADAQAERAGTQPFAESLQNVIEESDRDSQVYSDAEGTGSQGRPFEEPPQPDESPDAEGGAPDNPAGGLDLQA